jgi:threonine dehydratase
LLTPSPFLLSSCLPVSPSLCLYFSSKAKEFAQKEYANMKYINGYDDPEIIAGAGTMGIEILEQMNSNPPDVILVPVGGAGLIAGISLAIKTISPHIQVIGVEPENVASFAAALKAGHPVHAFKEATLADGLAVPTVGPTSFEVAKHFVDSTCVVSEKMIALGKIFFLFRSFFVYSHPSSLFLSFLSLGSVCCFLIIAMLRLIETEKLVVEGGGATGLAAILPEGPLFNAFPGKRVCVLLCGGNLDTTVLGRVIDRGLAADSRLIRFSATGTTFSFLTCPRLLPIFSSSCALTSV